MKAISITSIVAGLAILAFYGFRFFASGILEFLPILVAILVVLVGLLGLGMQNATVRIAAVESAIRSQQKRTRSLAEQLREEGILNATADQIDDEEIDAILK